VLLVVLLVVLLCYECCCECCVVVLLVVCVSCVCLLFVVCLFVIYGNQLQRDRMLIACNWFALFLSECFNSLKNFGVAW